MISKETIIANLGNCLSSTEFLSLANPKAGKLRDQFDFGDKLLLLTTGRQSAFDRNLEQVPFKGRVLNQVSAFWFEKKDIIDNHVIAIPDPNVTLAKKCNIFPIEFLMRGYLTGSKKNPHGRNIKTGSVIFAATFYPTACLRIRNLKRMF